MTIVVAPQISTTWNLTDTQESQLMTGLVNHDHLTFEEFLLYVAPFGYFEEEGVWGIGGHHLRWARRMANTNRSMTIGPRGSLKSSVLRLYVCYLIWQLPTSKRNLEALYMSFKQDLARKHCEKIKAYVDANPLFRMRGIVSMSKAASVVRYYCPRNGRTFRCDPVGVLSFKRGLHTDYVMADDLLKDPQTRMDVSQITKITETYQQQIIKIPKLPHGQIHSVGTPQDETDLMFWAQKQPEYDWALDPAIDARRMLLWPEVLSAEQLKTDLREMGKVAFAKEMLCRPQRTVDRYFQRADFDRLRIPHGSQPPLTNITGGWDLGKKRHPAHFTLIGRTTKGELYQVRPSWWFDGWDYDTQLEFIKSAMQRYHVRALAYDNTRGELELMEERGELPRQMIPVSLTAHHKWKLATDFDVEVTNQRLFLLDESDDAGYDRQLEQILAVDNGLDAMQTAMGHGDSFWSNALAIFAQKMVGQKRSVVDAYLRKGVTRYDG